jgi:hypothetical protein
MKKLKIFVGNKKADHFLYDVSSKKSFLFKTMQKII